MKKKTEVFGVLGPRLRPGIKWARRGLFVAVLLCALSMALIGASNAETIGSPVFIDYKTDADWKNPSAYGAWSFAIGRYARANGTNSFAIGANSHAEGDRSITLGTDAHAQGEHSLALGNRAQALGEYSLALGAFAGAVENSLALGNFAYALEENSLALGYFAVASAAGGVAIGETSAANRAGGVTGWVPDGYTGTPSGPAWTATTGAVSVGNDTDDPEKFRTRQIIGVAAGTADTDAVNVAQLKASATHYYSVNADDSASPAGTNYNNDGAAGANALAAGRNAAAAGENSVAIGTGSKAAGKESVALGHAAVTSGDNSVVLGHKAHAEKEKSIALVHEAHAKGENSLALGIGSVA